MTDTNKCGIDRAEMTMWWSKTEKPSIECTRVCSTKHRPDSEGTYIVRLSPANVRRLKLRVCNGAYLKVSYGKASVLACLSVDCGLNNETIRVDQTIRHAICLQKVMQENQELIYRQDGNGSLSYPIVIERSEFPGPSLLAQLTKQQYLICIVHHALTADMETRIARLTTDSMQVIGIQSGDKVLLISEKDRKGLRCLPLDPKEVRMKTMDTEFGHIRPCPETEYEGLHLPWVTMDLQTRLDLGVEPWQPIIAGRDPYYALASEFSAVALAVALSAVGGAIVANDLYGTSVILLTGLAAVCTLIWLKVRSRI